MVAQTRSRGEQGGEVGPAATRVSRCLSRFWLGRLCVHSLPPKTSSTARVACRRSGHRESQRHSARSSHYQCPEGVRSLPETAVRLTAPQSISHANLSNMESYYSPRHIPHRGREILPTSRLLSDTRTARRIEAPEQGDTHPHAGLSTQGSRRCVGQIRHQRQR